MTIVKGLQAIQNATQEKKTFEKVVKYLKAGQSFTVRIPSIEEVAEIYVHNMFGVFNTFKCERDDYLDKAVDVLYKEVNQMKAAGASEEEMKPVKDLAYALKAKPRYFFGFINLEDGKPMLIDLSKKQAGGVHAVIAKYEKKLDKLAFEISKAQGGTVSITPVIDLDDLTAEQRKHFEESAGKEIPAEAYESAAWQAKPEEQLEALKKAGFDLTRIGIGQQKPTSQQEPTEYPEF